MQEAWDSARASMPAWVGFVPLFFVPFSALWAWLSGRACVAAALGKQGREVLRRDAGVELHWTERARLWATARGSARSSAILFVLAAAIVPSQLSGPLHQVPSPLTAAASALAALLAGWFVASAFECRIRPELSFGALARGALTQCLVRFPHAIIAVLGALCLPATLDASQTWKLEVFAVLLLSGAAGAGLPLARSVGLVQPASARLLQATARAAEQLGHAPRAVYSIALAQANAFAFPLLDCVAFTPAAEEALRDDELSAIAAHEIAHLLEPRAAQLLRLFFALAITVPCALLQPLLHSFGTWGALLVLMNAVAWALLSRVFSRRLEARADREAHGHGATYARALEKIYQCNLVPAVQQRGAGRHPDLYDRMLAAGVTPDYPRPRPVRASRAVFGSLLVAIYTFLAVPALPYLLSREHASDNVLWLYLGVTGGAAWELGELGRRATAHNEPARAAALFRAALRLEPGSPYYVSALTGALMKQARCGDAAEELAAQLADPRVQTATSRHFIERLQLSVAVCREIERQHPLD